MRTMRRGGIGGIISVMVMIILLAAALVMLVSTLSKNISITQSGAKSIQKVKATIELARRLSMCESSGSTTLYGYAMGVKVNDIATFCAYVQALQVVIQLPDGTQRSVLIPRSDIINQQGSVLYSACVNGYKPVSLNLGNGIVVQSALVIGLPDGATVVKAQALISKSGWIPVNNCVVRTGTAQVVQQSSTTTILYSIGPVTVIAGSGTNPLIYMCPSPKSVLGDPNAYVIALALTPNITGVAKNHVPTSVVIDLKDWIKRVATPGSPLLTAEGDVNPNDYIRNITVVQISYAGGVIPGALSANAKLPWSYTFINETATEPLFKSSGILTFDFYANNTKGIIPSEAANYGALICLYVGVKGAVPADSTGEPFDGKLQVSQHNVTPPGAGYPCYSFSGYDICYEPMANLTSDYALNETSQAGMKFMGLQKPVDSTVRTYVLTISNPNSYAISGGCGFVFKVDLAKEAPELNGTPITLIGPNGERIPFCYETIDGMCTTNASQGDGSIWIKLPLGLTLPASGSLKFLILKGINGASSPYDVFPVYVDFSDMKSVKVIDAKYLPFFASNAFTYAAVAYPDNGQLNFVGTGKSFTVASIVRWYGGPNNVYDDTFDYFLDPLKYNFGSGDMPIYDYPLAKTIGDDVFQGHWLHVIAYEIDVNTDTGWMLALYNGYPTIWHISLSTDPYEITLEAAGASPLVPGVKYLVYGSYDATTGTWKVGAIPLEPTAGQAAQPLDDVPSPSQGLKFKEVGSRVDSTTQSLMYNLVQSGKSYFVISDSSRYYNDYYSSYYDLETVGSFSGMIYNVTVFGGLTNDVLTCVQNYNPATCPPLLAFMKTYNGTGIWMNISGTLSNGTAYGMTEYQQGILNKKSLMFLGFLKTNLKKIVGSTSVYNISFTNLEQFTAPPLPLGAELELYFTNKDNVHNLYAKFYGTPLSGGSNLATIDLGTIGSTIESGGLLDTNVGAIILSSKWLGTNPWNIMLLKPLRGLLSCPNIYAVRTVSNGGSYGDYDTNTGGWNIIYPWVPSIVSDGNSWLKWMIYEDGTDHYKITFVRTGFQEEAWRSYFKQFSSTYAPTVSSADKKYLSTTVYNMNGPQVSYFIYELPTYNEIYRGLMDLSTSNLVKYYYQLLPKNVTYIGFSYMDAYPSVVSNDTRIYYGTMAFRVPDVPVSATVTKPDLESLPLNLPLVYVKRSGIMLKNITDAPSSIDTTVLGKAENLIANAYGYLSNVTSARGFTNLTNAEDVLAVAPLWTNRTFVSVTMNDSVPINLVNAMNWTVYSWSNLTQPIVVGNRTTFLSNVTIAILNTTGDMIISFENVTDIKDTFFIGISNPNGTLAKSLVILANTTEGKIDGLLTWSGIKSLNDLNGTSIILVNKGAYNMMVNGPMCVPIPPDMGGMGQC